MGVPNLMEVSSTNGTHVTAQVAGFGLVSSLQTGVLIKSDLLFGMYGSQNKTTADYHQYNYYKKEQKES